MASPASPQIALRTPSKYASASSSSSSSSSPPPPPPPPAKWLLRTWTVTHSSLRMWRSAQNVRITYTSRGGLDNEDRVEYEDLEAEAEDKKTGKKDSKKKKVHVVEGANTAEKWADSGDKDDTDPEGRAAAFNWRGKGWLFFVTSHWEILAWGETGDDADRERWAVTWFAPTLFTREGIDIYSDRPAGLRPATATAILTALQAQENQGWPAPLTAIVRDLLPVAIRC